MAKVKSQFFDVFDELERAAKRKSISIRGLELESVVERPPYVMASVRHNTKLGFGFSKCSTEDKYDSHRGQTIAIFRAVEDLKRW
jgi:hypothetical protein